MRRPHTSTGVFILHFFGFIVDFVLNGLCKKPFQDKNMEYRVKQKNEKFSVPFVIYFFENEKLIAIMQNKSTVILTHTYFTNMIIGSANRGIITWWKFIVIHCLK